MLQLALCPFRQKQVEVYGVSLPETVRLRGAYWTSFQAGESGAGLRLGCAYLITRRLVALEMVVRRAKNGFECEEVGDGGVTIRVMV